MLILRQEAEDDMKKAYEWYEEKRAGLGMEFIYEVESRFGIIEKIREYMPRCSKTFAGYCAILSLIPFTFSNPGRISL